MAAFPRLAALASLLCPVVALAADAAPPPRPTPPPALTEAFKDSVGAWTCTGEMENPQAPGTRVPSRTEVRIRAVADGFAYAGERRTEKNAALPAGSKEALLWVFDQGKGKLLEVGVDNAGSSWTGTSDGLRDGAVVWIAEGTTAGQASRVRITVTRKSARELSVVAELENRGAWQKVGEDTCRKK